MRELSIFVDEAGDFGEYDYRAPYYLICLVMHDQSSNIEAEIKKLNEKLSYIDMDSHYIHAGPIIRGEKEYRYMDPDIRVKLLRYLMTFIRNADIKHHTFYVEKKHMEDSFEVISLLSKKISRFVKDNYEYFLGYDCVKIYYDNGQIEVNKILVSVFNALLDNVEFRRVTPSDYKLFQAADLICTLKLISLKMETHNLSRSELNYFDSERTLKKNYLKPLEAKEL